MIHSGCTDPQPPSTGTQHTSSPVNLLEPFLFNNNHHRLFVSFLLSHLFILFLYCLFPSLSVITHSFFLHLSPPSSCCFSLPPDVMISLKHRKRLAECGLETADGEHHLLKGRMFLLITLPVLLLAVQSCIYYNNNKLYLSSTYQNKVLHRGKLRKKD